MTAFAEQEASRAKLQARQRQEPDEDGFVMVTRGGRNGPARLDVAQEQAERQKRKQKGLQDFYRFQTREKNKAKAGELVRKFEEDKEKVRAMRERRQKFKVNLTAFWVLSKLTKHEAWVINLPVFIPKKKNSAPRYEQFFNQRKPATAHLFWHAEKDVMDTYILPKGCLQASSWDGHLSRDFERFS